MFNHSKFICPYCYEVHDFKDCIYTCSYNIAGTKNQTQGNTSGTQKKCKYEFTKNADSTIPIKYLKQCMKCDAAKLSRFCPNRKDKMWEIPERACENTFSIALIGAKESGKSNYIAVLVNEIKKKMSRSMDCSLIFCNQQTNDDYYNTYYKPLFENATTVKGTDASVESAPLIYSIDFFQSKKNSYKIKDSITLSLYDTAGENLDSEDKMLCNNQYISNANGIIVLLDPLQIPSVRKQLEGKVNLPAQNSDLTKILNLVVNVIKSRKKMKDKDIINIPIALTFTKLDVLAKYDIIPNESTLRLQSEHLDKGVFVKSDFENTDLEIRALLENFLADSVMPLLKQFAKHAFFGVSSLGEDPKNGVTLSGEPNPNRVLDPLLWLLSLDKHIKTI